MAQSNSKPTSILARWFGRYGFIALLLLQLIYLTSIPILWEFRGRAMATVDHLLVVGLFWTLLIAVTNVTEKASRAAGVLRRMLVVSLILEVMCLVTRSSTLETLAVTGWVFSMILASYITLRQLVRTNRVDFNLVCASLTVYISLGIIWSELYSFLEMAFPGSFTEPLGVSTNKLEPNSIEESVATIYYSFVTLTTLGFGDISPVTPMARMLTVVQALIGQMYLVVMVARFVGLHLATLHRKGDANVRPDEPT